MSSISVKGKFMKVEGVKGKVKMVAAGSDFNLFCNDSNELYAFGSNTSDGRSGCNYNSGTHTPAKITTKFPKPII